MDFLKIYSVLSQQTPLKTDCGSQCNSLCCQGDETLGMALFPGEEKFFEALDEDWFTLHDSTYTLEDETIIKLLVCHGSCPRDKRPLGCRIFPFVPVITDDNTLEIAPDLRAVTLCPLLHKETVFEEDFIDALYDVFEILIKDKQNLEFINILTEEQNELADFYLD